MAFEIVADEEVVQVVISDGVGDVCEHFAKKVHTRDCKGSRLAREVMNMVRQKEPLSVGLSHHARSVTLLHRPALVFSPPSRRMRKGRAVDRACPQEFSVFRALGVEWGAIRTCND